jgi:hypothetical protein
VQFAEKDMMRCTTCIGCMASAAKCDKPRTTLNG